MRIQIDPIGDDLPRPFWSVMIPTYNCRKFLKKTLGSVISQAPDESQMEIWVVDDGSPEGSPEDLVREIAGDRVKFHRHATNLGHVKNFEFCLNHARGEVVQMLHGDDYVYPGFYEAQERAHRMHPEAGAVFCRSQHVTEEGEPLALTPLQRDQSGILSHDWLLDMCATNRIDTPSITVKRAVYEELGGFDSRFGWTEDWEMWGRMAVNYPVYYITEILAGYRKVQESNTSKRYRTGQNVTDFYNAGIAIQSYIGEVPIAVVKDLKKHAVGWGIRIALMLWSHDKRGSCNNLKECVRLLPWFTLSRFSYNLIFKRKPTRAR